MSRIDWFIGFTSENSEKTTAKLLPKSFLASLKQYMGLVIIVKELTLF